MNIASLPLSEWNIGCDTKLMIAGPCSAESPDQLLHTASGLKGKGVHIFRAGIWKPRTRPGSFEGIGVKGLPWLREAGEMAGIAVGTEIAQPQHVELCLKHKIDALWIGARTSADPFAVAEIAEALKGVDIPVLVKNPVNPDIDLWIGALERIALAGIKKLAAIHRGFSTYHKSTYRNSPLWRIPVELRMRIPSLPLICDPSHISGARKHLYTISQVALDFLFNGLMVEVHNNPDEALSDRGQQITPLAYSRLINKLVWKDAVENNSEMNHSLTELRNEIDQIDHQILDLFATRFDIVNQIADLKNQKKLTALQLKRWMEILESRVQYGKEHHIPQEFVIELFELVHEHALLSQEKALMGG